MYKTTFIVWLLASVILLLVNLYRDNSEEERYGFGQYMIGWVMSAILIWINLP